MIFFANEHLGRHLASALLVITRGNQKVELESSEGTAGASWGLFVLYGLSTPT